MEHNSKRSLLRRLGIVTLIGGLAGGLGTQAWSQGGPGYGPHGHGYGPHGPGFMSGPIDPARMQARLERMVKHFAVEVDATPDQTAKLVQIAQSAAQELRPLREKAQEARKRGMELLSAPSVDRGALERLRGEQMQAMDAASKRMSQALADAADVLTPEQRKKAAEHMQQRRGWHRGGYMHRG